MNKYLKSFLHRGLVFGGFGPIVMGIVYLSLSLSISSFSLNGSDVFTAILSTYLLAFVHAGASVFNQIESWPIAKSLLLHFSALYASYSICYLINSWIPFNMVAFLIFTAVFIITYLIIWVTVVVTITLTSRKMNEKIES